MRTPQNPLKNLQRSSAHLVTRCVCSARRSAESLEQKNSSLIVNVFHHEKKKKLVELFLSAAAEFHRRGAKIIRLLLGGECGASTDVELLVPMRPRGNDSDFLTFGVIKEKKT